ncbi:MULTISPECIES: alanine/ornithine racemase family PLP-dependent enzyme [Staphylococcus]|uniref:Alanine/ornithine racemase family PLP-dependent enzyme n=1 Tax=Staphylococcus equorum TaxID=246432 RepID=A0AAW7AJ42_9STAP|nr:alanine/ornithine racemase family PLP-dependent enzyme [Staphylococcus equorum]MDK9866119.1 alanine/ornithine racemase family PLP-dependent enzyme [Staphylococcus equorum]
MAQLQINLSKIQYNAHVLNALCSQNNICFTPVTKCVAGDSKIIEVLKDIGITHFADARIDNITKSKDPSISFAMIGTTNQYGLEDVVRYTNISIQTEIATIRQLNDLAGKQEVKHQILLMVDWKDAREGILTYDVINYIKEIIQMHHLNLAGLAFNFMCFQSNAPTEEDVKMINQFVNSIEELTNIRFKIISGGNSSLLTQMAYSDLGKINELRIGETLFRGIETSTNHPIAMLYQDTIILEAEIVEIKPRINYDTGKQYLQAIIDIGSLDTHVETITPVHHQVKILGATSDHVMIDLLNQDFYQLGDKIQFSLDYKALAQSMYMPNIAKVYIHDEGIEQAITNIKNQVFNSL